LTVTPQPEAFMTMASTSPEAIIGHQASMLARISPGRHPGRSGET
jgi:hypothetical protein